MSSPPDAAPVAPLTDFAWATSQMQAGKMVKRAGWSGKYVSIKNAQSWMQLPDGFPTFGARVPWLWEPGDTTATDWEIV